MDERAIELARKDPQAKRRALDVRETEHLKDDPGFQHLRRRAAELEEHFKSSLAQRIWRGKDVPKEEVAFNKGFYEGIMFVLNFPEKADERLEEAARRAYLAALRKQEDDTQEESPYA